MKKVVRILLAILMVMCLTLGFTACKSECDKGNHTWDEGTITTAATCTQTGIKTFKCTACENGEKTEVIPKTDHTPVSADVTATCTQPGTTGATKCKDCGAVIKAGTPVDKLGHDYTGQPWKTENGKHYQECKRNCGARNEHQIGLGDWAVEGDQHVQKCTADGCNTITGSHTPDMGAYEVKGGRHISTCKVQGCNVAQGHDYAFGAWEAVGTKHVHTCTVEGCEIAEDHNENFGTTFVSTDETNHYKQCADCTLKTDEGAHDHDKLTKVSDSEHSVACSVCGHSFGNVAHNWVLNAEKSVESTCSVEGKNVYDCVCGAEKEESLPALPHTLVWKSTETTHTRECSVCQYKTVDNEPHGDDVVWNNTNVDEHWQWCKTCEHVFEDTRAPHDYSESFTCKDCDRTPQGVIVATFYKGEAERFDTLVEAVQSIIDDSEAIIYLGQDLEGAGIFIPSNRNINFRLQGNTYTVTSGAVGSVKYESQAFHIEKDSNITIQNGTITSKAGSGVKMLVQNYANLTLMNNLVLDGTNLDADGTNPLYTLSNNFGATTIRNTTILVSEHNGVAFDVWYGMKAAYLDGVSVTLGIGNNIEGVIEYGSAVKDTDWSKVSLVMTTMRNRIIRFSSDLTCDQANIKYADGGNVIDHITSDDWHYADRHHFHECIRCHAHLDVTECSETDVVTAKEPTCTEAGTTAGVQCSVCKTVIEQPRVIPANGHVAGDEYIITDSGHARKCTVCGSAAEKETAHIYVNSTCSGCGREIPVANIYALLHSLDKGETNQNGTFILEGKVKSIDIAYDSVQYFNITITIVVTDGDKSYEFYCFRVADTDELKGDKICVDDIVTLTNCGLQNFNGTYEVINAEFSGYKGADCEINYELSANYTIDGLPAKAERYTTVEFTVTATEGWRIKKVEIDGVVLTPGDNGKYTITVTENTEIVIEAVDVNTPDEHYSKLPDVATITNKEVEITNTSYKNNSGNKKIGDIDFSWKSVIKNDDGVSFNFNYSNTNGGADGLIKITAPNYITNVKITTTVAENFTFTVVLDNGTEQTIAIKSGITTDITVQAKTLKIAVTSGKSCAINEIVITYGEAVVCPNTSTTHHEKVDAMCATDGNIEYWECDTCHKYFADAILSNEIIDKNSVNIEKLGHDYKFVELVPATETSKGVNAHYECDRDGCNLYFDKDTKEVVTYESLLFDLSCDEHIFEWVENDGEHYQECSKCHTIENRCSGALTCVEDDENNNHYFDCTVCDYVSSAEDHAAQAFAYHQNGQHQGVCQCGAKLNEYFDCTIDAETSACTDCGRIVKKVTVSKTATFNYGTIYSNVSTSCNLTEDEIDGVKITYTKISGSNLPKYYDSGKDARLYNKSTMTIEANGITKIEFKVDKKTFTITEGGGSLKNTSSGRIWTGSAVNKIVFTITETTKYTEIIVTSNGISNCFHDGTLVECKQGSADCENAGYSVDCWHCTNCNSFFTDNTCTALENDVVVTEPSGHNYSELVLKREGDCQNAPYLINHYTCSICGTYFDANKKAVEESAVVGVIDPNAHQGELQAVKAATCTETGVCAHTLYDMQ